jgi:hypothetical protein
LLNFLQELTSSPCFQIISQEKRYLPCTSAAYQEQVGVLYTFEH